MFLNLPEDLNVVAITAANDKESSYGWYCGSESVVKGKQVGPCLGDEFSVYWMEDADKGEEETETLDEQFHRLVSGVTKSHVSIYGDQSFMNDVIGEYIGKIYMETKERPRFIISESTGDITPAKDRR